MNLPHNQSRFIVGLSGGIGSGKSTVGRIFSALGIDVVNADHLSRELVQPGQPALLTIAENFGAEVLLPDGKLDRAWLRGTVFADDEHKNWLEALLHPLIADLIRTRIDESESPYCILESPLLLETDQHRLVDRVLVVDVDEETQLIRTMKRDGSDATLIRSIIASQLARDKRLAMADDSINNADSQHKLHIQIENLHKNYLTLASKK